MTETHAWYNASMIAPGPTIRLLEPDTVAKLAAGEVIERPASVVRELVDNALDSGARRITVQIGRGGMDLVRVTDNGRGMSREDLRACTAAHATSKLASVEDLTRLSSLGFRGEALHSIAAVSRLRIFSRPAGEQRGGEVSFEGGEMTHEAPSGCPEGTRVEVRDLFFNTPARLRFLKGPAAEGSRVEQLVRRYVLGYPHVAFRLISDGRDTISSSGSGDLLTAIARVYGWRVAESMLEVELDDPAASVAGYVGPPSVSRPNRSDMHLYVNGRWVQSRSLLYAVQEAYSSLLMVGRFPVVVLSVRVPPEHLDVNVHPQKAEVRFADERGVSSAVGRAVRSPLVQAASPEQGRPPSISQLVFAPESSTPAGPQDASPRVTGSEEPAGIADPPPADEPRESGLPPLRILGQLAATYIIAEGPEGMCLIDQHAAHERVLLEQLQDAVGARSAESQALLEPVVVPLSGAQRGRAESFLEELSALGFRAEPFGDDSLLVRAVPPCAARSGIEQLVAELGEGLEGLGTVEERRRAMLATLACHSAIRAGQVLDSQEMRALIRSLESTRVPTACAHGRPTILELTRSELEREFGRRGPR